MTLEQLRIFVAVAEREHVTRGARAINLTPSATSAGVAALEARYATRLFDRIGRRIVLSEAGRLFLVEAKAVLARAADAALVLSDLSGLKTGSLRLAASQTVGNYWLPQHVARYRALHPHIDISLEIGNTEDVVALVRDGSAILGFVEGAVSPQNLYVDAVAEDELVLVAPPDSSRSEQFSKVRFNLRAAPWVIREAGSGTRAIFMTLLRANNIDLPDIDVALVLPTNESVRAAVEVGTGVSLISRLAVSNALAAGSLIALDYPLPTREFFMVRHAERYLTAAEREFVNLLDGTKRKQKQ